MGVFVPDSLCKYAIAFGAASILDPILVLIVDVCFGNFNCSNGNATCFNGDFSKLWLRMAAQEGSGISGLLITVILYGSTMILSTLVVYYYVVHIHRDGRILDLWRRVHADAESMFMPDDFEVSYAELRSVCLQAGRWRGVDGSTRELTIIENPATVETEGEADVEEEADADRVTAKPHAGNRGETSIRGNLLKTARSMRASLHWRSSKPGPTTVVKLYRIFEVSPTGDRRLHRQFTALFNGSIIELIEASRTRKFE